MQHSKQPGNTFPTAIGKLREHWAARNYHKALRLAASWPRLGEHKDAIQQGWAAVQNPDFYFELGKNPSELVGVGLRAVAERYELTPPRGFK